MVLVIAPMVVSKVSGLLPGFSFSLLGISYMTFRALDVALDICDGRVKTLSLWETAYFILFAPAISSGPLDRYRRFTADLHRAIPGRSISPGPGRRLAADDRRALLLRLR